MTLRPESYALNPRLAKADPYTKEWEKGTWSVEFKQPQLQIARSYTPLPPRKDDPPGDLRFLIREETNGEMSRYLARLADRDKVELRGPHTEVELPVDVTDVLFLAGGTGIAPALQVAHTLLEARTQAGKIPNVRIVWANRRRKDCVGGTDLQSKDATETGEGAIVQGLRKMQNRYPDNLQVEYFVDEEGKVVDQRTISRLTQRPAELTDRAVSAGSGSKLLFVSGPEGFVNFLAGPKKYRGGEHLQGELGGLIGKMGIRGWEVWKQ
ncbi:cytochrome b reductase [Hyphodiscus hymeniophilus]|uniref:Cytochrome b reductase n=1 Tax=Hyphodiscus hymeniophilus TaxID=353542 RepID=A0A9P6VI51_9HELO|nr:cytochrome b reductase [Hyphodiscus hymeniophilus]